MTAEQDQQGDCNGQKGQHLALSQQVQQQKGEEEVTKWPPAPGHGHVLDRCTAATRSDGRLLRVKRRFPVG